MTLLELVLVGALLAILAVIAVPRLFDYGPVTLPSQAEVAADLVRRGQGLAAARGAWARVQVVSNGKNGVVTLETCAPLAASCTEHSRFEATHDISVGVLNSPIYFNSLGQPVLSNGNAATADTAIDLSVTYIDSAVVPLPGTPPTMITKTVSVNVVALTGRVYLSG